MTNHCTLKKTFSKVFIFPCLKKKNVIKMILTFLRFLLFYCEIFFSSPKLGIFVFSNFRQNLIGIPFWKKKEGGQLENVTFSRCITFLHYTFLVFLRSKNKLNCWRWKIGNFHVIQKCSGKKVIFNVFLNVVFHVIHVMIVNQHSQK